MALSNPWLSPLQRSYNQIKSKLLNDLSSIKDADNNQLITDLSEGNIFVILISLFSGIAEVLHYYIDMISREAFLPTAQRYESVVKHAALVDYHPKAAVAATVDVVISRSLSSQDIGVEVVIPKDTTFTDSSGNSWLSTKNVVWAANTTSVKVPLRQREIYNLSSLVGTAIPTGGATAISLPTISGGNFYEQGTLYLTIGNDQWALVDTFAYSGPTDKHFMVETDNTGAVFIKFGDGRFGMKPTAGSYITSGVCFVTKGSKGNILANSIKAVPVVISNNVSDATCNNPYPAGGGSDPETFNQMKEHIPLSVRTLGVAITKQDFLDLAKSYPGVNKAAVDYECGRKLTVYISPDNNETLASQGLCEDVYNHLASHAPMTTWLNVKSAGIMDIMLNMEVTGKTGYSQEEIRSQVIQALMDRYSIYNSDIGGKVRLSDIYALIDNLSMVDYLHVTKFYMKPWPITLFGNTALIISSYTVIKAKGSMVYIISMTSSSTFDIRSKSGGFVRTNMSVGFAIPCHDVNNGIDFTLAIAPNSYQTGNRYQITVSEPNHDYEDPGFNIPVFTDASQQLVLTVNEVL